MPNKSFSLFLISLVTSFVTLSCVKYEGIPEMNKVSGVIFGQELSNQNVKFFLEDNDGMMWIATERGLNVTSSGGYVTFQATSDTTGLAPSTIWGIYEDHSDRLWVSSGDGIYQLSESFLWKKIPIKPSPLVFRSFYENSAKDVFAGNNRALYKYNSNSNCFEPVFSYKEYNSSKYQELFFDGNDDIWRVYGNRIELLSAVGYDTLFSIDSDSEIIGSVYLDDYLWVAHRHGLQVFDVRRREFIPLPQGIASNQYVKRIEIKLISKTRSGFAIVSSADAIYFYDTHGDVVTRNINYGDRDITVVYESSDGNYWLGYNNNGYEIIDNSLDLSPAEVSLKKLLQGKPVKNLSLDVDGNLYALYGKSHLAILDKNDEELDEIDLASYINTSFPRRVNVDCMLCDAKVKDIIWTLCDETLFKFKRSSGGTVVLQNRYKIDSEGLSGIYQDSENRIIVYGKGHYIYVLDEGSSTVRSVFCSELAQLNIQDVTEISPDELLICSRFDDIKTVNLKTGLSTSLFRSPSYFYPTDLYKSSLGEIFIATNGSGIFYFKPGDTSLQVVDSKLTTFSESLIEFEGVFYIGTNSGLCHYDILKDKINKVVLEDFGDVSFSSNATCRLPNGKMLFGTSSGIIIINPSVAKSVSEKNFFVSEVETIDALYVTQSPANSTELLRLSSKDKQISINTYIADTFGAQNSTLRYRMDNEQWQTLSSGNDIVYKNLSYGRHIFRITSATDGGVDVNSERKLIILIDYPFFLSPFMMLVYVLLIAIVFLFVLRVLYNINKAREDAKRIQYEKEMQQIQNERNMDFFTNMSHEFRTPLTMIVGATDMISRQPGLSAEENKYTRLLFRNASRMQRIVDQLLDMSKVENNSLSLNVKMVSVSSTVDDIVEPFRLSSESKGVKLLFETTDESLLSFVDVDVLEKSLYNLLSNALKFTPSGGSITVKLDTIKYDDVVDHFMVASDDNYIRIRVIDSGIGIPEDKRDVIFNKFYQIEQNKSIGGTGVGLYFTKQIVRLHHGDIIVQSSEEEGSTGSQFSIVLPMSAKSYTAEEMSTEAEKEFEKAKQKYLSQVDMNPEIVEETQTGDRKVVLAIDDDPEVLFYLRSILGSDFKVVVKFDATSGYGCLAEVQPDIVISDVLMLDMNGYELCEKIKESSDFSHIPVILLTAKSSNEDRIKGLEAKADAYITKPFEPAYLVAQINNLIQKRESAREIVSGVTLATKSKLEEILHQKDRDFMDALYKIMEENLINEDLDVTTVYEKMGFGRSSFYNKVKDLTGVSPASLFRTYKLNRAKEILESGKYKISAVAEMTGFCSASYFSTLFKKEFGVTPKEFMADKI